MERSSENSRDIKAPAEKIYRALTDPAMLIKWRMPGDMTAKVHRFELKVGGGYEMSLYHPDTERDMKGKTGEKEDRFSGRFIELIPGKKVVEAVSFESSDTAFAGEMIVEVNLRPIESGTRVTFLFKNIPAGIRPEDNETGTRSSLEKLARLVE